MSATVCQCAVTSLVAGWLSFTVKVRFFVPASPSVVSASSMLIWAAGGPGSTALRSTWPGAVYSTS